MTALAYREEHWTSAENLQLYCRIYDTPARGVRHAPRALTVLCLPGLTRNSRDFEALAPHLATRYRVICPDLRGRGRSARDPKWQNYHPGTYLTDLQRLLEALELERVAIVGTSLGGLLGMLLGAAAAQRVAGLVLNDIGPEVDPRGLDRIRSYTGMLPPVRSWDEAVKQLRVVYGNAWPDLSDETWSMLVHRSYRADSAGVPVLDCDPRIGDALRAAPAAAAGLWPLFARLHAIPMLVVHGAMSDILNENTLERMQREKPDLERVTVVNRGHVPLLDEPEALAAIERFLARLRP
ncbi:MAG TPA: alpha/beta hydrolase [Steroidobacteraceae bacterium]|nr:alpha/beta hydrolase [Steroidobacteraceae bacterium]